jgi:hypothetical protein
MLRHLKTASMVLLVGLLLLTTTVQAAIPPPQSEGLEYVVQVDDWLSKLAEKYMGNSRLWRAIVEATNAEAVGNPRLTIISDPNLIYPGQVIFIPTGTTIVARPVEPVSQGSSLAALCQDQHPAIQAMCATIPIARVQVNPYDKSEYFTCVSRAGLAGVALDPAAALILIPNDGDFDLRGIASAVKVDQAGAYLIPRWPGSRFDFSVAYAERFKLPAGEQWELPLAKAFELAKAGELIWTGQYGVAGRAGLFQTQPIILTCDPQAEFKIEIGPFNP